MPEADAAGRADDGDGWRPRLVATDLDGTLVPHHGAPSEVTRRVLAALDERGVPVVLVTARPLRWMDDLWPLVGSHGLAVVSNGALTWDVAAGRPLRTHPFDPEVGRRVVARVAERMPGAGIGVERVSGLAREAAYLEDEGLPRASTLVDRDDLWSEPGLKLLVQDRRADPERLRAEVADAVGGDAVATWTLPGLVEVSAAGVDKGRGLAEVCEDLGVDAADVAAFGDMPNDVPMLSWAGRGHAVAGAHAEVLAVADAVVGRCEDDGVARALASLFDLPSALMGPC